MLVPGEQKERPRGRRSAAIIAGLAAALLALGLLLVALLPFTDGGLCIGNGPFWLRGYRSGLRGYPGNFQPGFQQYDMSATRLFTLRIGDLVWHLILLK